jgi:NADH dehydrogenase
MLLLGVSHFRDIHVLSEMSVAYFRYHLGGSMIKGGRLTPRALRSTQAQAQTYPTAYFVPSPNYGSPVVHCLSQGSTLNKRVARAIYTETRPRTGARLSTSNTIYKAFSILGFCVTTIGAAIFFFFLHDSSTYRGDPSAGDIPVAKLALEPRRGGPKNLPVADFLMGEYDSKDMAEQKDKPRLVVLGTGWGSIALLKSLRPGDYHVTVISPTNYFLFTPMLPSATMGTIGLRSLVEPVRRIVKRLHGHFLKATVNDVLFSERLVEASRTDANGEAQQFYVPYDKLVVAVGMFCASIVKRLAKILARLRSEPARR